MGDSAAMMVDALTYLFNWYAERQKRAYSEVLAGDTVTDVMILQYQKYRLQLELVPPLISVSTLLVVTVFVLRTAIQVLILDITRDVSLQSDPNVNLMMLFSFLNLLLDVLNVFCFAKAKHAFGYDTSIDNEEDETHKHRNSMQRLLDHDETGVRNDGDEDVDEALESSETSQSNMEPFEIEDAYEANKEDANLNMCSAYTHVFADTLRSTAVIIATMLADFVPAITPEEADASAAVVVSALILLSLVPLARGMMHTVRELRKTNDLLAEGSMGALDEGKDDEDVEV